MSDASGGYDDDEVPDYKLYLFALIPKPSALLSIIGSYVLIREVLADQGKKRGTPLARVLLMMSVSDIFVSLGWLLTTWPSPSDLDYIWGNVGTKETCTAQAALFQFGLMSAALFSASLAFFNLLIVRWSWTDHRLAELEKWVYGSIWTFSLVVAIFPIPLGLYNNSWIICWFEPYPYDCRDESDCTRGEDAWIYGLAFTIFPVWFCMLVSIVMMGMIFASVRRMEDRSRRYASTLNLQLPPAAAAFFTVVPVPPSSVSTTDGTANQSSSLTRAPQTDLRERFREQRQEERIVNRNKSRAVAQQAYWYMGTFLLTFSLDLVSVVLYYAYNIINDPLDFFAYVLLPLQGFFNFLVFSRRRVNMETREGRFLRRVLWNCCCSNSRNDDDKNARRRRNSPPQENIENADKTSVVISEEPAATTPVVHA